jgi:signal transduction histidine kinase
MDRPVEQHSLEGTAHESLKRPRGATAALWAVFGLVFAHAAHGVLGVGGAALDPLFSDLVYNAVFVVAATACLARSILVRQERFAWLAIGIGLASWATGEIYWTVHLSDLEQVPYPSLADAFYLGMYPAFYAGIVLLVRDRVPRFHPSVWLDGAIGALGTATIGSAILYPAIKSGTGADASTVATNLAYPLGDLLLLSFVGGVLALTRWRPGRAWIVIAVGLLVNGVADGAYLYVEAGGTYVEGGAIDSLWLLGGSLVAFAAWCFPRKSRSIDLEGLRLIVAPSVFGLSALALLAQGALTGSLNRLALGLATATLFAVLARMMLFSRENLQLVDATERASRAKSDFLANMSHELRTPLTAIIGYSEMFLDGIEMDDEERTRFASRILSNGQHLHGLINDLLDLSKVEAGMMDFRPETVNLTDLLEEIELTMRVLADNNRVHLRSRLDPGIREVVTDRAKLKQVLLNYLSNAIKYTPPGGQVTLSLEPEGEEHFRLTVQDTGIGIRAADQLRLFKVFHQVDLRAAKEQQGTGLGLALVKQIVEAQGGRVGLESEPGRGSLFFAVLPTLTAEDDSSSRYSERSSSLTRSTSRAGLPSEMNVVSALAVAGQVASSDTKTSKARRGMRPIAWSDTATERQMRPWR